MLCSNKCLLSLLDNHLLGSDVGIAVRDVCH